MKKVRAYTSNQVRKICQQATKDLLADMPEAEEYLADAAHDMAQGLIAMDERIREFLKGEGIDRKYWAAALAEYYV